MDVTSEEIFARIDSYELEMVNMQIQLTAIPALAPENGGDGECERALFLKSKLREFGFRLIEDFNAPDERVSTGYRPNLICVLPGKNTSKTVWIMTHIDTVPPGEISLWDHNPYQAFFRDGRVFGLGTEDNQQDLVASIFMAKAFIDEKSSPPVNIGLLFLADEETGSKFGIDFIASHEQCPFKAEDILIAPDYGNDEGSVIEIAEKSLAWLKFRTVGRQCHASKPFLGKNANVAGSNLVVRLSNLYRVFNLRDPVFSPDTSTFEPTKREANVKNINTIPGEDVFYLDCRVLPNYQLDEVMQEVRRIADSVRQDFGVDVEITPVQTVACAPPTPADSQVVRSLGRAIREVYGVEPELIGIGGGTVAAPLRKRGLPTAVWSRLGQMAHQPNEYCSVSNMIGNAKVFSHIVLQG